MTEIRGESFYLYRTGGEARHMSRYEVAVPAVDVPALLAALDQVTGHLAWRIWQKADNGSTDTSWVLPPGEDGEAPYPDWSVTRDGDAIVIRGPWVVWPPEDWQTEPVVGWEIAYQDVEELRRALLAADERSAQKFTESNEESPLRH
ncbi:hypothetical protein [Streptomyces sp. NPDC006134]|uniref:hypothetical protein n=1 Tax=Streptomyces sp. NPDC006134 TaxID=3154467 RepID=UPI0033C6958C